METAERKRKESRDPLRNQTARISNRSADAFRTVQFSHEYRGTYGVFLVIERKERIHAQNATNVSEFGLSFYLIFHILCYGLTWSGRIAFFLVENS